MILRTRAADEFVWNYLNLSDELSLSWALVDGAQALQITEIQRHDDGNICSSRTFSVQCYEADLETRMGWVEAIPSD